MRRCVAILVLLVPLLAQPAADQRFEVASLKPNTANELARGIRPAPGGQRHIATNCSIKTMIQVAYRIKADQIVGGPGWLDSDRFDMVAKAEKPSNADQLHGMLINLLADRLQLKFHHDKKEMRNSWDWS